MLDRWLPLKTPMKNLTIVAMILMLAGCTTLSSTSTPTYTPEVRSESSVSTPLFHDVLTAFRGVGYLDKDAFPMAKERTLVRIEVVYAYDSQKTGIERWTIKHDDGKTAVYQVVLIPDGEGSTDFTVTKLPQAKSAN